MLYAISTMIHYDPESIARAGNTLVKALYLKRTNRLLKEDPNSVISDMESVRKSILQFQNLRVVVVADLEKLKHPVSSWKPFLKNLDTSKPLEPLSNRRERLSEGGKSPGKLAYIVPLPTIDSSFSTHVSRGPTLANDPKIPALMVAVSYLDAVEGPMWVGVRGTGLAYGTGFSRNTESGMIQFRIYRSPNAYNAFVTARKVISDFISGDREFDSLALEGAVSSIVVSFVDEESTISTAAYASFVNQVIKGLPKDFNAQILVKVQKVTIDEVKDALKTIIMPIFTPGTSNIVVTCAPAMEQVRDITSMIEYELINETEHPARIRQGRVSAQCEATLILSR
jgi:Zn-dependent M16 (insulinase) family peptidase